MSLFPEPDEKMRELMKGSRKRQERPGVFERPPLDCHGYRMLSSHDAAEFLGITVISLYWRRKHGKTPGYLKQGLHCWYAMEDLEECARQRKAKAEAALKRREEREAAKLKPAPAPAPEAGRKPVLSNAMISGLRMLAAAPALAFESKNGDSPCHCPELPSKVLAELLDCAFCRVSQRPSGFIWIEITPEGRAALDNAIH